jgi:hypothetical protein
LANSSCQAIVSAFPDRCPDEFSDSLPHRRLVLGSFLHLESLGLLKHRLDTVVPLKLLQDLCNVVLVKNLGLEVINLIENSKLLGFLLIMIYFFHGAS